mmetsp:Transcript_5565/g.8493  ORF Transcript_5565/g.8493 Transcript_5565/m.8493 type:complete len:100 (-) Transcript_5565:45-344(-)
MGLQFAFASLITLVSVSVSIYSNNRKAIRDDGQDEERALEEDQQRLSMASIPNLDLIPPLQKYPPPASASHSQRVISNPGPEWKLVVVFLEGRLDSILP